MSWAAKRYKNPRDVDQYPRTRHHVPPRHPDKQAYFIKRVNAQHHRAYHMLFGAAPSLEVCIEILKRDWWTQASLKRIA